MTISGSHTCCPYDNLLHHARTLHYRLVQDGITPTHVTCDPEVLARYDALSGGPDTQPSRFKGLPVQVESDATVRGEWRVWDAHGIRGRVVDIT